MFPAGSLLLPLVFESEGKLGEIAYADFPGGYFTGTLGRGISAV